MEFLSQKVKRILKINSNLVAENRIYIRSRFSTEGGGGDSYIKRTVTNVEITTTTTTTTTTILYFTFPYYITLKDICMASYIEVIKNHVDDNAGNA